MTSQEIAELGKIDDFIKEHKKNTFIDKKRANIYYKKLLEDGSLPQFDIDNEFNLNNWYEEACCVAVEEFNKIKDNSDYVIWANKLYTIETLAYVENYLYDTEKKRVKK